MVSCLVHAARRILGIASATPPLGYRLRGVRYLFLVLLDLCARWTECVCLSAEGIVLSAHLSSDMTIKVGTPVYWDSACTARMTRKVSKRYFTGMGITRYYTGYYPSLKSHTLSKRV
jgi:hypothetical protein